jgi:hypothetical protein
VAILCAWLYLPAFMFHVLAQFLLLAAVKSGSI